MRSMVATSAALALGAALALSPAVARAHPATTTYTTVGCWVGWEDPYWRPTGRGGQVEHDGAVITTQLWVHDALGWRAVGTEIDTVMDVSNSVAGTELYRGSFTVSSGLGNFVGTFVWTESKAGSGGHGEGRATDGSGRLWKSTAAAVDPADTGVPECAADREVYNLTRLEIVSP